MMNFVILTIRFKKFPSMYRTQIKIFLMKSESWITPAYYSP